MIPIAEELKCVIKSKDGLVSGYIDKRDEGTYYKFKSIPYAKPPIGSLRFLPPFPIKSWTGEMDCTKDANYPLCFSVDRKLIGSEDCLYIEVSTPNIKPDKLLPVMFWIGSYGFLYYMDTIYDPILLNEQDVVFVRCGFRLGPFGFLSINDISAPGNNGLKDIVMALKWVQRNISAFGGDPNNVTIFGNSTGGAIVHFMMLSPMASSLFHKAIIQSASALNNWSLEKNPSQAVMQLAKELGITNTCMIDVIEELRSISGVDIMKALTEISNKACKNNTNFSFDAIFKPCIEVEFEGQPAFLTKSPALIIKSGNFNKVPIIIGSNNIESSVLQFIKKDFFDDFQKYKENVCLIVPRSLTAEPEISKDIARQLLKFYLGGEESLREDNKTQYLQLVSDYYFLYYLNKTVRLHSQVAPNFPIYYYIMNYAGNWSLPPSLNFLNCLGHCAEIPFVFQIKMPDGSICKGNRDSVNTRCRVVRMWTNFAKYGNPTPKDDDPLLQITWDPIENSNKLNYLSIGSELTKGRNPFHERMTFWEELHKEHTFLRVLAYFNDLGVSW